MTSRRHFLRMLGATAVGTLAHEQLSWLARQPTSVINNLYPYRVKLTITGLSPSDGIVSVHRAFGSTERALYSSAGKSFIYHPEVDPKWVSPSTVELSIPVDSPVEKALTISQKMQTVPDQDGVMVSMPPDLAPLVSSHHVVTELERGVPQEWTQYLGNPRFDDLDPDPDSFGSII